jgi:carbon-monoxide dehydrogenase iron sulfur subunit
MKRIFVDIDRCLGCRSCEIACAVQHTEGKNLLSLIKAKIRPKPRVKVQGDKERNFPLQCRHCEKPFCVDACIAGGIKKDPKTGLVTMDEDKCVGCWTCVMVCPFGVIRPSKDGKIAVRCDLCQDEDEPACVVACPTGAIFFGELEEFKKLLEERTEKKKVVSSKT